MKYNVNNNEIIVLRNFDIPSKNYQDLNQNSETRFPWEDYEEHIQKIGAD